MNYHFYKSYCKKASRIIMQSSWEGGESLFVDLDAGSRYKIGFQSLIGILKGRRGVDRFIYHAQSSLPYLCFTLFYAYLFRLKNLKIIYDVHDLHEFPSFGVDFSSYFKSINRFFIFYALEYIVCRSSQVSVITVSPGLATLISERYRCKKLAIVRNISISGLLAENPLSFTSKGRLVYFGLFEHISVNYFEIIARFGFSIDIYGRGDEGVLREVLKIPGIRYVGQYVASDMSFLSGYVACILVNEFDTLNNKMALPNKLYQSLYAGLGLVVTRNFEHIASEFSNFPDFVYVLSDLSDVDLQRFGKWLNARGSDLSTISRAKEIRGLIDKKIIESKSAYLSC